MAKILFLIFFGLLIFPLYSMDNSELAQVERMRYDSYTGQWFSDCESSYCYYCGGYGPCLRCHRLYMEFNQYNLNDYPFYYNDPSPFNYWGIY